MGVHVELRPREFALLAHLARDPAVWGYRAAGSTRTLVPAPTIASV
ncbi:MAG: helix-turn-helix domain-containing protein [Solirubrobacteraceae bacterium]